ncbi:MAG: MFS transporter [Nocardioides sp.]
MTRHAPTAHVTAYRWVVLAAFMAVNLTIQVLWISYAPITSVASDYYGVPEVAVGALAMSFMVAYLPLSMPASAAIAHRGFRAAVGFGSLLAGVAGVARGLAGSHYVPVLLATLGAAAAQPFLLNAWTTMSAHWFPRAQRATAVSLVTLANLVGAGAGLALTPQLEKSMSVARLQLGYGAAALAAGILFVVVARDRPAVPPDDHTAMWDDTVELVGVRHALHVRPFLVFLTVAFVGMGVFNGISTWVEEIVRPRGLSTSDAGGLGALLLLGGILGAVILSALSDHAQRRVPYLTLALGVSAPALLSLAVVESRAALFGSAFVLGFFLTSAMPIGMQYSAEITVPTPEGTTNGLIQLAGQASVVFVLLMELTRTPSGSFTPSLAALAVLLALGAVLVHRLPEPHHHLAMREVLANAGDREQDGVL